MPTVGNVLFAGMVKLTVGEVNARPSRAQGGLIRCHRPVVEIHEPHVTGPGIFVPTEVRENLMEEGI